MRDFRCHADGLSKRRMRVNRLADVHRIGAHLNRQRDLANHVARMRANHATAQDLAMAQACHGRPILRRGCRRTAAW